MGDQIDLRCRCGEVRGRATGLSPRTVNRVVCYCDDCQAFAHQLGRADLLDPQGGSDIVQMAPAAVSYTIGQQHIVGLRLKPNGLYRWYAKCCNTPLGNTFTPTIPFVGLLAPAFDKSRWDQAVGAPSGAIFGKYAVGGPPPHSTGPNLPLARPSRPAPQRPRPQGGCRRPRGDRSCRRRQSVVAPTSSANRG